MLAKVANTLLELHRDARRPAVADFPRWAFEIVKPAVAFDSAFWGSGCALDGEIIPHAFWFHNLPRDAMQTWAEIKHLDTIAPILATQLGRVLNLSHSQLQSEHKAYFEALFRPLQIVQILCTYAFNPATGIYDAISLYRSDPKRCFTEEERLALECLVPNLIEARRANYLNHAASSDMEATAVPRYMAAADTKGILYATEDGFARLLAEEWPGWRGPRLPAALIPGLVTPRRHLGTAIAVDFRPVLDVTLLYARHRTDLDKLSDRQIEIGRAFCSGQSHKEIARDLNLAPATVRNHLSAIYKTLAIGSKAELATLLAHHERQAS